MEAKLINRHYKAVNCISCGKMTDNRNYFAFQGNNKPFLKAEGDCKSRPVKEQTDVLQGSQISAVPTSCLKVHNSDPVLTDSIPT